MSEVVILVGNIGCGKTTLTKVLCNKYVIVSRDAFRYSIGAGTYKFDKRFEPAIVKSALYFFEQLLETGYDLVVDEVNVCKEYRKKYIDKAKLKGYSITAIELPRLSMQEAVDRRMKNPHDTYDKKIWEEVWNKFDSIYEEPSKEEGFDKIIKL